MLSSLRAPFPPHLRRFLCTCNSASSSSSSSSSVDMVRYCEAFERRMAMAGIKPHHRIALGISGGADSMALCVLVARWKEGRNSLGRDKDGSGFLDGVLGIIVDHRLRPESAEEAKWVSQKVSHLGIRCKIVSCNWPAGMPKQGHLEEAARDMRYGIFQDTCIQYRIGVLMIAHHEDDQAELLILRLSRNSGVLGLACMAFVAQLFPKHLACSDSNSSEDGILLVRPMLEFSKKDMYKICQIEHQDWVEDPSNQSLLFARNRIRKSLKSFSDEFRSELQALISACRLTRSFVEHSCGKMMEQSVTITNHGYAIIDLRKLNPCEIEDLRLTKLLTFILQFVSQRHRQIRGCASQLLLDYIRHIPCKNALTAAGCYLCPSPGSKGTKILVCCSPDSQPSKTTACQTYMCKEDYNHSKEKKEIIMNAKLCNDLSSLSSNVPFLQAKSSSSILEEAKKLNIISDETCNGIQSLQLVENQRFITKADLKLDELTHTSGSLLKSDITLACGQMCLFMNRFQVRWKFCGNVSEDELSRETADRHVNACGSCMISPETEVSVRCMVDADWLHVAKLSEMLMQGGCKENRISSSEILQSGNQTRTSCADFMCLSAKRALENLKSIPAVARRALPVLVDSQGLLLSIPAVGFQRCACMGAYSVFRPQVPLGGGFSLYI